MLGRVRASTLKLHLQVCFPGTPATTGDTGSGPRQKALRCGFGSGSCYPPTMRTSTANGRWGPTIAGPSGHPVVKTLQSHKQGCRASGRK